MGDQQPTRELEAPADSAHLPGGASDSVIDCGSRGSMSSSSRCSTTFRCSEGPSSSAALEGTQPAEWAVVLRKVEGLDSTVQKVQAAQQHLERQQEQVQTNCEQLHHCLGRQEATLQTLAQQVADRGCRLNHRAPWRHEQHTVFVGNLAYEASETDLWLALQRIGPVRRVYIVKVPGTERSRGCAFVDFEDHEGKLRALQTTTLCLWDRQLRIAEPRGAAPKGREGPGWDRGGGNGARTGAMAGTDTGWRDQRAAGGHLGRVWREVDPGNLCGREGLRGVPH